MSSYEATRADTVATPCDREQALPTVKAEAFRAAFVLVASLFFLWAIAHNLNDILIKQFEKALQLNRARASLIQVSFYVAYFVFALPIGQLMKRIGLKWTLVAGLGLYAAGAAAFYPAAALHSYTAFLIALFVLAGGIVCLEIAAGAFIVLTGNRDRSSFRINLVQGFNGLGAMLGPLIGGRFIFSGHEVSPAQIAAMTPAQLDAYRHLELHQVQLPYIALALITALIGIFVALARFPPERARTATDGRASDLIRRPRFLAALLAQFFYVGAQVTVWSFYIDFAKDTQPTLSEREAALLLSVSVSLFMVGRFLGSLLMRRFAPAGLLFWFGLLASISTGFAVLNHGSAAVLAVTAVSFFMSIMYPTIFAMGLAAAEPRPQIGAAIMVMAIVGGAVLPPALGLAADRFGVHGAYLLNIVCFAVVMGFAYLQRQRRALF